MWYINLSYIHVYTCIYMYMYIRWIYVYIIYVTHTHTWHAYTYWQVQGHRAIIRGWERQFSDLLLTCNVNMYVIYICIIYSDDETRNDETRNQVQWWINQVQWWHAQSSSKPIGIRICVPILCVCPSSFTHVCACLVCVYLWRMCVPVLCACMLINVDACVCVAAMKRIRMCWSAYACVCPSTLTDECACRPAIQRGLEERHALSS